MDFQNTKRGNRGGLRGPTFEASRSGSDEEDSEAEGPTVMCETEGLVEDGGRVVGEDCKRVLGKDGETESMEVVREEDEVQGMEREDKPAVIQRDGGQEVTERVEIMVSYPLLVEVCFENYRIADEGCGCWNTN